MGRQLVRATCLVLPILVTQLAMAQVPPPAPARVATAAVLDAAPLQHVLDRYLREGRVDYAALAADTESRRALGAMLDGAARLAEAAPLSSWLNLYNAFVIELVLRHYPIASVMKVDGFFKRFERVVAGKSRSLDTIEHDVIRKRFPDARVHFALNCAAQSCPTLSSRVFDEATLDAQLERLTREALGQQRHVRYANGTLELSALFTWFETDFVRDAGSVPGFLRKHAPTGPLSSLADDTPRAQLAYDWTLNDIPHQKRAPAVSSAER